MSKIAFLGPGAMGSRMAASLVAEKHLVTAWNRNPARTAPLLAAGVCRRLHIEQCAMGAELDRAEKF